MISLLKALLFGLLEGVTEWLPISSTGHLILLDRVLSLSENAAFVELFEVVIQLGAILAVAVIYWRELNPLAKGKDALDRRQTLTLWGKVLLATLPSAAVGLLLDDWISRRLFRPVVVACALIFYGVLFLLIERPRRRELSPKSEHVGWKTALWIGFFQVLALVPGTSRSGATILGGITLGLTRQTAARFSFFLAIPTMLGAGLLKMFKLLLGGTLLGGTEWLMLGVGTLAAFLTSLAVIRFLIDFVRRHSFAAFGVYRILLGGAVLAAYFCGML